MKLDPVSLRNVTHYRRKMGCKWCFMLSFTVNNVHCLLQQQFNFIEFYKQEVNIELTDISDTIWEFFFTKN